MSKKQETSSTQSTAFQFDPTSQAAYRKNIGSYLPFAQSLYQDPYGSQMFQQESAQGQAQAAGAGQRGISNIMSNAAALGYGTNSGMINALLSRGARDTSALQGQAFRGALGSANQRAMQGLGIASSFQPLMTGSDSKGTQTQTTSGLGTWLPQLLGAGLGAGMGMLTGGASAFGGLGSMGSAGSGVMSAGAGAGGIGAGLGSMFGAKGGYGYGSGSPSPFGYNPYANPFSM